MNWLEPIWPFFEELDHNNGSIETAFVASAAVLVIAVVTWRRRVQKRAATRAS